MPGEIDYAAMWSQASGRRDTLRAELDDLERLIQVLAPLAERTGMQVRGLEQSPAVPTPVPSMTVESAPAEGGPAVKPTPPAESREEQPQTRTRIYRGRRTTDAALHVMWARPSQEWPTPLIATGIEAGGFESDSPNFRVNIYTTMKRLASRGLVERVGEGRWVLTEAGCGAALAVAEEIESESTADVGASAVDSEDTPVLDLGNPSPGVV